ncbi:allantoinase AllB [Georgenia sp. AZ-5]|uniref:allantoinase AllB n=1 Tax=Georgenia sp. AZ-5 TaxID=3367526 RepID=UPI00375418A4
MPQDHATFDLVVRSRAVLLAGALRPAAVAVRCGRIAAVADADAALPAREEVRLPPEQVLLPGLVDTHVHVDEPGRTEWEGFATATRAAAAGGVTTLVDMPLNSVPPTVSPEALAAKRRAAAGRLRVDVGFWGGAVPENLGLLRELCGAGVLGFKCFLAPSGVPEFGHLGTEELWAAQRELAELDGLLLVHAEDPAVLAVHAAEPGRSYRSFVDTRPVTAETTAVRHVIEGLRRHGGRAHIVHLSAAAALPLIGAAKDEGLGITAETCPHYLLFAQEDIPDGATEFKCCPPIRDRPNQDALWRGLLDGTIDAVVSDHSPSTAELKHAGDGDFSAAWGGVAGLQVSLPAAWTEARRRNIALEKVAGWMSTATAGLAGLSGKGAIAVGADADLVAFAPEEEVVVDAAALHHRNKVSAYDGVRLRGAVRTTWLRGAVVSGAPGGPDRGRMLLPDRAARAAAG